MVTEKMNLNLKQKRKLPPKSGVTEIPSEVKQLFELQIDSSTNRDQYGLEWEPVKPFLGRYPFVTGVGALLAGPKRLEDNVWPAFAKTVVDPMIAEIGRQRKVKANHEQRFPLIRKYFMSVVKAIRGCNDPAFVEQTDFVNKMHTAYGIYNPDTRLVYPELQRSFAFISAVVVKQMQNVFETRFLSRKFSGVVHELWHRSAAHIGMTWAPCDTDDFLAVHDQVVRKARHLLHKSYPSLIKSIDHSAREITYGSMQAVCKRRQITEDEFWNRFTTFEQEVLR